jgi:hypothetical protein
MLLRLGRLGENGRNLSFVYGSGKGLFQSFISLFLLQGDRLIEQVPALKIVQDEVKEVNVLYSKIGFDLWNVLKQEVDVLADSKLVFGGVIKYVKADFVTDPAPGQQLAGDKPGQNLV